jgi:hypothetical protein
LTALLLAARLPSRRSLPAHLEGLTMFKTWLIAVALASSCAGAVAQVERIEPSAGGLPAGAGAASGLGSLGGAGLSSGGGQSLSPSLQGLSSYSGQAAGGPATQGTTAPTRVSAADLLAEWASTRGEDIYGLPIVLKFQHAIAQ